MTDEMNLLLTYAIPKPISYFTRTKYFAKSQSNNNKFSEIFIPRLITIHEVTPHKGEPWEWNLNLMFVDVPPIGQIPGADVPVFESSYMGSWADLS